MTEISQNPDQLKEILKSAIAELIRDNRQEVSEFLALITSVLAPNLNFHYIKMVVIGPNRTIHLCGKYSNKDIKKCDFLIRKFID